MPISKDLRVNVPSEPESFHVTATDVILLPFVAIEHRTHHRDVRQIIEGYLPRELIFVQDPQYEIEKYLAELYNRPVNNSLRDPNVVGLDYLWMVKIIENVPLLDKHLLREISEQVSSAVAQILSHIPLQEYIRMMILPAMLAQMTHEIELIDRIRKESGLPSTMEVIRHLLGLERCRVAPTVIEIKI